MSPFSHFLSKLRLDRAIRQSELAERLGYDQSYISALEVGLKGPPTADFISRLILALELTPADQKELHDVVDASYRKLTIDPETPQEIYWLMKDLRDNVSSLCPLQIRMIRDLLSMKDAITEEVPAIAKRAKRRRKEEATM